MIITKNPAALAGARRVQEVKAFSSSIDTLNPTETRSEFQSELLAVRSVMRRCRVSYWHAQTICRLYGLGGRA